MGQVLALVDDLFFIAKMQATSRQVGIELRTVSTGAALVQGATEPAVKVIVVDLNARANPIAALEELKSTGNVKPTIAFLSHIQTELAERAKALGSVEVMPRSRFSQNLAEILLMANS
jgi:DNA-binding NarL/FixJ family response regulator